jgi:hypothetical protein
MYKVMRDGALVGESRTFLDVGELILTLQTKATFNLERVRTSKCS